MSSTHQGSVSHSSAAELGETTAHRGRLLVAARGFAAAQLLRASRGAGWQPVAVYADPDFDSLPVRQADFAVAVPGTTAAETYENPVAVVAAAVRAECQAIHPGFGELRHNLQLRQLAQIAGIKVLWQGAAAAEPLSQGFAATEALPRGAAAPESLSDSGAPAPGGSMVPSYTGVAFVRNQEVWLLGAAQNLVAVRREVLLALSMADLSSVFSATQLDALRAAVAKQCVKQQLTGFVAFDFEPTAADVAEPRISQVSAGLPATHSVFSAALGVDLLRLALQDVAAARGEVAAVLAAKVAAVDPRAAAVTCRVLAADASLGFAPQHGELIAVAPPAGPGTTWEPGYASGDQVPWDCDGVLAAVTVRGVDRVAAWQQLAAALRGTVLRGVPTTASVTAALAAELAGGARESLRAGVAQVTAAAPAAASQQLELLKRLQQLAISQQLVAPQLRPALLPERGLIRDTVRVGGREFTVGLPDAVTPATLAVIAAIAANTSANSG
ncbi:biotin carboxylase N-terminal domain-containing protein [Canibacter oris]|uniref:biotin carboxylase n=1 Tax=Canibacter oris TaxID=1365628 RepID=A0A840DHT8_9MICO|nr:biotin carboxylase N-terminal domain-containing protein [Canibacter oris]MBB4071032.1 biotin carboxylase [Canibacter oris]